jgi:hypothetical protein
MSLYAVVKGAIVDGIAVADVPLNVDGVWVCVDGMEPQPGPGWRYENDQFSPPPEPPAPPVVDPPAPPKTEEEKLAEATAAAIAKLIADGVLKQA